MIARDKLFWEEISKLDESSEKKEPIGKRIHVDGYHPILAAIGDKNLQLIEMEGEYSIYEGWLKGNYRDLAQVPNIDNYRYLKAPMLTFHDRFARQNRFELPSDFHLTSP